MTSMEKNYHKSFTKCPVCKLREELAEILGRPDLKLGNGQDRFLEQLGEELKARGLARPEWSFHLDVKQGTVVDPAREAAIPIGSEVPAYGIATDICMDCGCIYAIDIARKDVKKGIAPLPPTPITRLQRTSMERGRN